MAILIFFVFVIAAVIGYVVGSLTERSRFHPSRKIVDRASSFPEHVQRNKLMENVMIDFISGGHLKVTESNGARRMEVTYYLYK